LNILFTGKGTSGSWQCRGVQLGGLLGTVKPLSTPTDCTAADVIVVVKRINHHFIDAVKASGKPWIWDLVDFYPQPECGEWSCAQAVHWARQRIRKARPHGIVYPNAKMASDVGIVGDVIYHHARPAPLNPIREQVKTVGYEGCPKFLGRWRGWLHAECAARGWQFVEGAPLHQVDIVVALRDGAHNGYVQRMWKSNVKLANAHGTGTPFVGMAEAGYTETATGAECWVSDRASLRRAFDRLTPHTTRQHIHRQFVAATITLDACAEQLKRYAQTILRG